MPRLIIPAVIPLLVLGAAFAQPGMPPRPIASKLANADDVRRVLGLTPNYAATDLRNVKVAVLDAGFAGFDGKKSYLPADTVIVEHYDAAFVARTRIGDATFTKPFTPGDSHGRLMAQTVWATTGSSPDGPHFYLLNANGPTMFRRAVRYAVEQKVDVILFSGTFEGGGNYDGHGTINAAVDEATAAGIIWVNAAGNSGGAVYNGPVVVNPDGYLRFRTGTDPTALRFTNRFDENTVTITLTWNDYHDAEDAGTDKDLDLFVEDSAGRVMGSSTLKQIPAGRNTGANETKNPRERVVLTDLPAVKAGQEYRIRVKANSNNFGVRDRIRVLVTAARDAAFPDPKTGTQTLPVKLLDASGSAEIYPPADHPAAITVGDTSRASSVGPTADGRIKPDVVISDSRARFSTGDETVGSSNAAAYFAGIVTVLKATQPSLTASHLRAWSRFLDVQAPGAAPKETPLPPASRPIPLIAPPTPVPLSPNEARAQRYAESLKTDNMRQPGLRPLVVVSGPNGVYQVNPGGSQPQLQPNPPTVIRAAPPAEDPRSGHVAWRTPTPNQLADLVRGR